MAIPTSPSIVVLENDVSIYTPNINSSVVGVVGFANKGPVDLAKLVTSPEGLIKLFGKPSTVIPGQGLEGALEILEATNQLYYVRVANASAAQASTKIPLGSCPALEFDTNSWDPSTTSSITVATTSNANSTIVSSVVTLGASSAEFPTKASVFLNTFNPNLTGGGDVFGHVDSNGKFFLASKFAGSGASLQITSASGGVSASPVSSNGDFDAEGFSSTVTAYGYSVSGASMQAFSVDPGAGYNLSALNDGSTQGLSIEVANISTNDKISVNSQGSEAENFNVNTSTSSLNFAEDVLIDSLLNNKSDYVYLNAVSGTSDVGIAPFVDRFGDKIALSVNGASGATPRFVKLIEGTYGFDGGHSGFADANSINDLDDTDDDAIIGTSTAKTGIYALDDDNLNISLAVIPGITNDNVQNALITLAESSKNFLALVAPPYGLPSVQDAFDWLNGKGTRSSAINSSYAAAYWPWVQVFNPHAGAEEWYDPAIYAARQCVFTDSVSEPWFAPAGFRRGRLTKPSDTEMILNQGDRDALYSNSLNPVIKDPTAGISIFGQKTTQRLPTSLDRVNVRRLMIYVRKVLLELGKPFQFEPNDSLTWELVEEALKPFISDLLARRAIVGGAVKCDQSTNTAARVDRNELWCSVSIKPTKAAETVVFEVNLTSQSATLNG
tara:strand:- start:7371 stop:9374 length:2004 start_codon:yes stop_codon:yes gene_type:complete